MYETFDHTADLGLRIRAANLPALFAEAGQALTHLLVENLANVQPLQRVDWTQPREELPFMLFDFLSAILTRFEEQRLLLAFFEVQLTDSELQVTAHGEPLDRSRHEADHEVKAITYHGLRVEPEGDGWLAEVIVDI
ncbi:MAG: archease [Gemmataceae bacterium]